MRLPSRKIIVSKYASSVLIALSVLKQATKRAVGVGQLSLVEHSLCPLASSNTRNLVHAIEYRYSDAKRKRKTAKVRIFAPLGLSPTDELYLWGLLNLTLAQPTVGQTLTATPHWCLKQMGIIDAGSRRGGRQYRQFSEALKRLSVVNYLSDACFDPTRGEYRKVSFGFLSYSLPVDPQSNRAWTIRWDPVFFDLIQAKGGSMRFDLALYRSLDAASRRLLLLLLKIGYRKGRLPVFDLRHLAVDLLGLSNSLAVRDMKIKVARTLRRLENMEVIASPSITRIKPGQFSVSFERGEYMNRLPEQMDRITVEESPLMEGLLAIGFEFPAAVRIVRRYSSALVSLWTDITQAAITQAAIEQFGQQHFRVSPMAFFVDSIKKASQGTRTPPDWWQDAKRKERRSQKPTEAGKQVLSKLMDEVFGSDREAASTSRKPERAADLLKRI